MREVYRLDQDGFYLEPVELKGNEKTPSDCTEIKPTGSFIRGQFANGEWKESATQEEIDAIKNTPVQPSEFYQLREQNADLNLQIIDIWETLLGSGVIQ
jgi:hypothetical protein